MSESPALPSWREAEEERRRLVAALWRGATPPPAFFDPADGTYRVVRGGEEAPAGPDGD